MAGYRAVWCWALIAAWTGTAHGQAFNDTPADAGLIDPSEIPSVHNTFYQVPDGAVSWDDLGHLEVEAVSLAPLQTDFRVKYSDKVAALDGQTVKVMGFLFPIEAGSAHKHFLLTAWPPGCPYCLPAGPSQMVDVYCAEPVEYADGAIMMAGRFEVLHNHESGMYYRMTDARLVERFDDIRWTGELTQ